MARRRQNAADDNTREDVRVALHINSRLKRVSIGAMLVSVTGIAVAGSVEPFPFET
jgi:hypothetical protein